MKSLNALISQHILRHFVGCHVIHTNEKEKIAKAHLTNSLRGSSRPVPLDKIVASDTLNETFDQAN